MTTNQQRAANVLHRHHENCNDAATALAVEGLLAPLTVIRWGDGD